MKNKISTQISCPHCHQSIDIKEAIAKNYRDELQSGYENKLNEDRKNIRSEIEKKVHKLYEDTIKDKDQELTAQSSKIVNFNKLQSQVRSLERKNKEVESEITLKYEEKLTDELDKKDTEISESKIQITQLRSDLDKMQKRASQGSVQLQGEAPEVLIEDWLKEEFPDDNIKEVKKGTRGADIIHEVILNGESYGKICIESKRADNFQPSWIEKIKDDAKDSNCQIAVIVTNVLPKNFNKGHQLNGVWICTFAQFKILIHSFRLLICELSDALSSHKNRTDKTSLLYNYTTSQEFRMEVESIVDSFIKLQEGLETEKRSVTALWKKREKQHTTIVKSTSNIYGALKGILGNSIKQVNKLELPSMNNNKILKITNHLKKKKGKK